MKKYSLILIMLAFAVGAWAQKPRVTTFPAAFTLTEDVTLTIDVTGTALEGMSEDLYLWAWSNNGDNLNNGSWDNSGANNRLTKVGDMCIPSHLNVVKYMRIRLPRYRDW